MMKGQRRIAQITLLICLLLPTAVFAQDEETVQTGIRARIAKFIEGYVTNEKENAATDAKETADSAESTPLDPTIVSGIVGGAAIAISVILIVRGYQQPRPRDPFRSRW